MRVDDRDAAWPLRPWLMAAICAVAGVALQAVLDFDFERTPARWAMIGATFISVATVAFVLTLEQRRWWWSALFALAWGGVIALVGVSTSQYNHNPTLFEWPFLAGIFAVLLAAPLFQAARDEGAWRFPPLRAHTHAWTDAVIGAASLLFVLIAFALAWLIAGLFNLIGITALVTLLKQAWFGFALAGFAFGAGIGLLRERDGLVATMQRLVMVVLGVLAPVLAAALLLFLVSLPLTGLAGLWNGALSAAAMMLVAGAGASLLINAAIGHGDEARDPHPVLHWAALLLALVVLPLAGLAMAAMMLRVGQYGWTPERMWGVLSAGIAIAYGVAGWWAVIHGRTGFAPILRVLQVRLALVVCAVALLLSLPLLDFGAISARSQLDRLAAGKVAADKFDWTAMAFDFGPAGRDALARIARRGPVAHRPLAAAALHSEGRYSVNDAVAVATGSQDLDQRLTVVPASRPLPKEARQVLAESQACAVGPCRARWIDGRRFLAIGKRSGMQQMQVLMFASDDEGRWQERYLGRPATTSAALAGSVDTVRVEVREVRRSQVFIDGEPASEPFE